MDKIDARLTKQHLSTRIFKGVFLYLERYYPEIDLEHLCNEAGLPLSYLKREDNWVSILFDCNFLTAIQKKIPDPKFEYKVGSFSVSKESLGATFYALGKNALTLDYIYKNIWRLGGLLNKVIQFELVASSVGEIQVRVTPKMDGLDEAEKRALKACLPFMIKNTCGYYAGLTKFKNMAPAEVTVTNGRENEYIICVRYPVEKNAGRLSIISCIFAFIASMCISEMLGMPTSECLTVAVLSFVSLNSVFLIRSNHRLKEVSDETERTLIKVDEHYKSMVEAKIDLQRKLMESEAINQITNKLIQTKSEEEILNAACECLCQILEFDRTLILMKDAQGKFLEFRAGHLNEQQLVSEVKQIKFEIDITSSDPSKISNVFRNGTPILIPNVLLHLETLNAESRRVLKMSGSKSFLCVPIKSESVAFGILLADTYHSDRVLNGEDLQLLTIVGRQIAMALEKQRAQTEATEAYIELGLQAKSFSRFVPWETINLLGYKSVLDVNLAAGKELKMAILFSDIRGFTTLSESMSPSDAISFLNSYFSYLAPVFQRHNGIIDKFLGDGIMVLFTDPKDAIRAVIEFQTKLREYNLTNRSGGKRASIAAGIGLHYGKVLFGALGFKERLAISVVSDSVNLTSRLDGLTKKFGVDSVCTDDILAHTDPCYHHRLIAQMQLRGRSSVTNIYEIYEHLTPKEILEREKTKEQLRELVFLISDLKFGEARKLMKNVPLNDPVFKYYDTFLKSEYENLPKTA